MNEYYESGPEGMPRVERMTDSTIMAVLSQKNVPTIYVHSEQDYASLCLFAHAIAEETLARVPAWPAERTTYPVSQMTDERKGEPEAHKLARILWNMVEAVEDYKPSEIYRDGYQSADGDIFVHRAATVLVEQAAEIAELVRYVDDFGSRLAAAAPHAQAPAAAPVAEPVIDTADLAAELERQWLAKTISDLRQHGYQRLEDGPFRSGWETALDEIEARCGKPAAQPQPHAQDNEGEKA